MTQRIANLRPGQEITLRFHGSKSLGNEPYELDVEFLRVTGEGEDARAFFDYGDGSGFEAYRYQGRWAYGTSAERLSVVK